MVAIASVRDALRNRLAAIGGNLHVYDEWPDQVVPPAALLQLASWEHDQTFGADWTRQHWEVVVVASKIGGLRNAQLALEPYLSNTGASSIRATIAADRYLASTVKYTHIPSGDRYGDVEINSQEFLGAFIAVDCEVG